MDAWESHGYPLARLETLSMHELQERLRRDGPVVVDVRTETEWNSGHIDGAMHIHGGLLRERYPQVPCEREVAVICGSGYRGSIAASFLKRQGYPRVANVLGGMNAWRGAGMATVQ